MEKNRLLLCPLILLAFGAGCAAISPYDRGDYRNSPKLRHSGLPLRSGTRFTVRQGAFGKSSHSDPGNQFSWDLEIPWGTPIVAAEDGTVLQLYQPAGGGGCDAKYSNDAWNVLIENTDGTVAQYTHVEGSVHKGDRVKKGRVIGKNVKRGWICYPHVHYSVYRSREDLFNSPTRENLPLYFESIPGGILLEGHSYVAP